MRKIISRSVEETKKIGYRLGKLLEKGDVVCLTGDLGAGKTTFTKSIARGLDVEEDVTSPTFTIINEYNGRLPVYHFDVYRINDIEEMYEIGFEEYFYGEGVCIVEWASKIEEIIPNKHLWIEIRLGDNENSREFYFKPSSNHFKKILEELDKE
ncbi:tRNA threonylcarbamoyladenosine biosynthesis protein TsaE [Caminicella sporogenes DSM 14501]|uniref:tRNA threonylcarbamoyladenosine biosynthesis protein TsaE n=1 Tax=Caminicella sporogenes DSM 14501 TaxID=1121266 RepID=A0A1M6Q578_9FIRM|nr:tRNA (adenosine(37)-N6)-threonylcarbamoyltransferase complex ATPase subunit type 1 TsaE [Caminicella sporogenes]RKD23576.1 tRNA (N6-adenosine(37)-N6)-threonylcarbamoyltransferase complex ATPase TsaE [Caminicella sporogenes]SHK15286.1 tRNA threonylcarbamoyladenosine biosynthesis protein TsaE [Caminicella sporogenes DSM 14501]